MTSPSVLIVTRNYPPLTGGMERLMRHITDSLAQSYSITLIGPSGCAQFCPANVNVIECPAHPALFLPLAFLRGIAQCLRRRFRFVFGGSGLVAGICSLLARLNKAESVLHVHGLDIVANNRIYQRLFVPWIRRNDKIIANSGNTRDLAVAAGCDPKSVFVLNPGVALPVGGLPDRDAARDALNLTERPVLLFVGRIVRRKGLGAFLHHAWPQLLAKLPNALLLVVGDTAADALARDPKAAPELAAAMRDETASRQVRFLGAVDDAMLDDCYAAADTLIFPLIEVTGDVEGFGMVAIEASARGTPTVTFAVGGVLDAVKDGVNGRVVTQGDYSAYCDAVLETVQGRDSSAASCIEHARTFAWSRHREQLLDILRADAEA